MYKITGIDIKNNRYKVLDMDSNIENICTKEQLLQAKELGFVVYGLLPDGQVVVWDTFYKLALMSGNGIKNLEKALGYCLGCNVVIVTDEALESKRITGNCKIYNLSNRTNIIGLFTDCPATDIDLSSFDASKLKDMECLFKNLHVRDLNLNSFNALNVTNMRYMFENCKIEKLDLSDFKTSSVSDMGHMFDNCHVERLDLRSFDTSNVKGMGYMFKNCQATYIDLSSFDTSKVVDMEDMFYMCKAKSLNLSKFKVSNLHYTRYMFDSFLGEEIILRKSQMKLIRQALQDGQGNKIRYL